MGILPENVDYYIDTAREKKDIEAYMGDWQRKYADLERRLELVRRILSEYTQYVPPFNRAPLHFERVESY